MDLGVDPPPLLLTLKKGTVPLKSWVFSYTLPNRYVLKNFSSSYHVRNGFRGVLCKPCEGLFRWVQGGLMGYGTSEESSMVARNNPVFAKDF